MSPRTFTNQGLGVKTSNPRMRLNSTLALDALGKVHINPYSQSWSRFWNLRGFEPAALDRSRHTWNLLLSFQHPCGTMQCSNTPMATFGNESHLAAPRSCQVRDNANTEGLSSRQLSLHMTQNRSVTPQKIDILAAVSGKLCSQFLVQTSNLRAFDPST